MKFIPVEGLLPTNILKSNRNEEIFENVCSENKHKVKQNHFKNVLISFFQTKSFLWFSELMRNAGF